jgi:hypothetical protein
MILAHSVLGGDVAEHVILLLIVSSHAPLDALCAVPLQDFRFFSILLEVEHSQIRLVLICVLVCRDYACERWGKLFWNSEILFQLAA